MTPQQLELVHDDVASVAARADEFATDFYATLFELDPSVRKLFSSDMAAQRQKLMRELTTLVELGVDISQNGSQDFERRATALGVRHRGYGVVNDHYSTVGVALLAALERSIVGWSEEHVRAWTSLYAVVADVMQSTPGPASDTPSNAS